MGLNSTSVCGFSKVGCSSLIWSLWSRIQCFVFGLISISVCTFSKVVCRSSIWSFWLWFSDVWKDKTSFKPFKHVHCVDMIHISFSCLSFYSLIYIDKVPPAWLSTLSHHRLGRSFSLIKCQILASLFMVFDTLTLRFSRFVNRTPSHSAFFTYICTHFVLAHMHLHGVARRVFIKERSSHMSSRVWPCVVSSLYTFSDFFTSSILVIILHVVETAK